MRAVKLYVLMIMMNVIAFTAVAQKKKHVENVLEITGAALLNNQRISDYSVSVYLDGTRLDSLFTKSKKSVKFYVAYNKVYTFLFQKQNCVDKIMIVNTQLPDGLKSMEEDSFDFEVEMSQSLSKNSKELEDYPVAVLLIDKKEQLLQASSEYNKFTHSNPEVIKTNHLETESDKNKK